MDIESQQYLVAGTEIKRHISNSSEFQKALNAFTLDNLKIFWKRTNTYSRPAEGLQDLVVLEYREFPNSNSSRLYLIPSQVDHQDDEKYNQFRFNVARKFWLAHTETWLNPTNQTNQTNQPNQPNQLIDWTIHMPVVSIYQMQITCFLVPLVEPNNKECQCIVQ